ncbi:hypothetical protein GYMLUDRAFT_45857 [Collybiopsis luxurians FD-317 M1]|uniref:Late embryogenesis abundant protein LEA-2 subgroup domain-containing protein n=1 Tax=Collybiopsis luxurians FD-317 M1 TaxID=944289 RepID=A0A0D0CHG7_9AGAR|nr:hypothetical protein GYMLUDRAFT_45857 [Collybiopsis luxurians FD-317 M1]
MAYRDQYAGNHEFNPYSNPQPHATYEAPTANPFEHYEQYQDHSTAYQPNAQAARTKSPDQVSGFDRGEFGSPRGEKAANFSQYRREFRDENLWTKGGRGSCIGRFICCTLMIAVFMIVSILLALALWIRPPSIVIGSAGLTSAGTNGVQLQTSGIKVPLEVNISVSNPNYFAVDLKKVTLDLTYPLNGSSTGIGNGNKSNVNFPSHSNTNFTFPFEIDYEFSSDPNYAILIDMAKKCGVLGGSQADLTVDYKIQVDVRILVVTISPTVSNSFSISCPFDESTLKSFVDSLGLSSILGSG